MSLESVKNYFKENNLPLEVTETDEITDTVENASKAFGITEGEIAKTMGFQLKSGECILILTKGTAKIDNQKFKSIFHEKAVMIKDIFEVTSHEPGGLCPFGLKTPLKIYLDETLKEYQVVYPAGGTPHSAVKISVELLEKITKGKWINICK
ncbi:YbaK/EbsC family protein [Fusobacterium sp.]|uniref:YbaK/EbsC family protein n=1 Tax=Fusobacterium sp. TaxID=68766 RepID=UPI00262709E2|nr:YbaK/EbsC family protein [Fusobacterium sp.]